MKNNIQGVWRLIAEDTEKYRIYTEGFRLDLTIARYEPDHVIYSIDGRVYNVKHNEDSLILDDISGCTFEFLDKERVIITNPELGKGVYELFKRSKLPEDIRRIFKQQ